MSDQLNDGDGQVGLLPQCHHAIEKHFQYQRDQGAPHLHFLLAHSFPHTAMKSPYGAGGPLGPDGPGWERIDRNAPNGHGLIHYPLSVREEMERLHGYETTPDGHRWPKPELVRPATPQSTPLCLSVCRCLSRCLSLCDCLWPLTRDGFICAGQNGSWGCGVRLARVPPRRLSRRGARPAHPVLLQVGQPFFPHCDGLIMNVGHYWLMADHHHLNIIIMYILNVWLTGLYRITTEQRAADRHAALCDHWADWHGMTEVVAEERAKAAAAPAAKL